MSTINKNDFVSAKVRASVTPGKALKMIRELQGLSQNELATISGIAQSNISALENESCQLGRDRAIALADALSVHPSVLLFPDYQSKKAA